MKRRQIPVFTGGEVGRLAASFNLMLERLSEFSEAVNHVSAGLRELVLHVQGAAEEVAFGSDAVAASTGLAARSNEATVTAVETITATLHQMSANIQNVAQNAQSQSASTTRLWPPSKACCARSQPSPAPVNGWSRLQTTPPKR